MPTFLTERMVFLHMPKTGGTWLAQAVAAAGVQTSRPDPLVDQRYSHHGHASLLDVGAGDRFSVAFVRHPLDWWRSYWAYRMRVGWDVENELDRAAASDDFNEFVTRVVDRYPGHLDDLVKQFVGSPAPKVDFVGRFEYLVDDACTALRLGGEPFYERAVRAHPNVNVSDYDSFHARYRPDVAARLADAEGQTIERFYPEDPIPATFIAGGSPEVPTPGVRARPSAKYGELQRLTDRVVALERALDCSRRAEQELGLALSQTRGELDQTERALDSLRASNVVRYTRPLRIAYYRTRAHLVAPRQTPPAPGPRPGSICSSSGGKTLSASSASTKISELIAHRTTLGSDSARTLTPAALASATRANDLAPGRRWRWPRTSASR
jgi:hypothetical protein